MMVASRNETDAQTRSGARFGARNLLIDCDECGALVSDAAKHETWHRTGLGREVALRSSRLVR
jgi:hypothetical protein